MPTLTELIDDYERISAEMEAVDQIAGDESDRMVATIAQELMRKVDAYEYVLSQMESEAEFYRHKEEEYRKKRQQLESHHDRLKTRLKQAMRERELTRLQGESIEVVLSRVQPKLIIDEDLIPSKYKVVHTTYVPDKIAIREALVRGESVPGARLEESVSIKFNVKKG